VAVIIKKFQKSPTRTALLYALLAVALGSLAGLAITGLNNPFFVMLALGSLVVVIATVASAELGLLLFVFITYTRFSDIAIDVYNAPSVAKFFVGLLIVAIFIRWAIFGERPEGWQVPAALLGLYGLVGFFSLLYAENSASVLYTLSNYVKDALITLVIVVMLKRGPAFRHVIWTLLAIGIFLGSLSVFQHLTGTFTNTYGGFSNAEVAGISGSISGYRLTGPIGDPNFYAQVMVVLIPIAIERMLHERKPLLKVLAGLAAVLCTLTVVFTFSRGGFLAAMVVLGLFAVIYPPRPLQLALLIALAIGIFFLVPSTYFDRILTLDSLLPSQTGTIDIRSDNSIQGRASQYLTAWAMFKQHPLLGVGLSNFAYLYPEFSKEIGLAPSVSNRSVHSLYLEVLTETGILGMSIFLSIIGFSFRSLLSARRIFLDIYQVDYAHLVTGLAVGFVGYLTAALFIHAAFPRYFYLLIGIILSLPAIAEQVRKEAISEGFRINLSQ
jgi:putative inorganic carbon (HCO3(-)) transporter